MGGKHTPSFMWADGDWEQEPCTCDDCRWYYPRPPTPAPDYIVEDGGGHFWYWFAIAVIVIIASAAFEGLI